ncbi:hypothetical protein MKW98_026865 [Papaver atlanticum]|uniref:Neprosin PEP catalytic domain-containing protein n=1 Tax=Papaver atlanticum TaxID=357466 RepID=A0AAD4S039_9MAGN|nr:hypothetical protein MKW98_026865 [Papaver atlanticum]
MAYLKSILVGILMILVLCLSVLSKYGVGKNCTNTKKGDTIDCIDIYKQPAFDHPLLKDHKICWNLNFIRKQNISKIESSDTKASSEQIHQLGKEIVCPVGTVPIRRTTKRELIFSNLLRKNKQNDTNGKLLLRMNHHYVSVETPYTYTVYNGAIASFGIHTPSVTPDQYSTSQMWIQNGVGHATNSIEAGWAVYPELFGDHNTRIFSQWTADGYISTGCFNTMCTGFVQIHSQILFGAALNPLTPYGKEVFFSVIMDEDTKSWWFCIGNEHKTPIGYWPSEIFIYLPGASLIRFGGIAGAMPNTPSPPMGNGNLPTEDYKMESTGFMRFLQVVEVNGDTRYFGNSAITQKDTSADCYDIIFRKYGYWKRRKHGYNSMIFGGPGGNCP